MLLIICQNKVLGQNFEDILIRQKNTIGDIGQRKALEELGVRWPASAYL
jgi:hypothetical protein